MFDPNQTYLQSLKIVSRGLIQWPLCEDEIDAVYESVKTIGLSVLAAIVRLICLLTLPLSAPILTLVIFTYRKLKAKENAIEHK